MSTGDLRFENEKHPIWGFYWRDKGVKFKNVVNFVFLTQVFKFFYLDQGKELSKAMCLDSVACSTGC